MGNVVKGFIIEADKKGYYYHRSRMWIAYDAPELAYVWTEEETTAIIAAANPKWELKPGTLYPATFTRPVDGVTDIEEPPFDVKDFNTGRIYSGNIIPDPAKAFTVISHLTNSLISL